MLPVYAAGFEQINHMLRQGKSFSGHERNCVFLNTGGRFANVSAVSGFDFKDDCRAIGTVDWDYDGRPDYWVTNRTGPTLRLMRNTVETSNHFVAVRLSGNGETTNRDAIGARVEVKLAGDSTHKWVKAARAGNGFLSQSSRWLHFGLAEADSIEQIEVTWPNGEQSKLKQLKVDRWYDIVQNEPQASEWTPPTIQPPKKAPEWPDKNASPKRTLVGAAVPLPEMLYQTFKGRAGDLGAPSIDGKSTLVAFWATWCPSCLEELTELRDHATELEAANVDVVALSVDGLGDRRGVSPEETLLSLARLSFPFSGGMAGEDIVQQFHLLDEFIHDRETTMAVPFSALISAEGTLIATYEGPVSVSQLVQDATARTATPEQRLASALPFPGRWLNEPARISLAVLGDMFMDRQRPSDAETYYRAAWTQTEGESRIASVHSLADCLAAQDRLHEAAATYEQAINEFPHDVSLRGSLAAMLLETDNPLKAEALINVAIKDAPKDSDLHALLGSALLAQRKYALAVTSFHTSIAQDGDNVDAYLGLAQAAFQLDDAPTAIAALEEIARRNPQDGMLRRTIALGFVDQHDYERATYYFQEALKIDDEDGEAHFELARCLDRLGDHDGADVHFKRAAELSPDQPVALNQYGIVLARRERYDEAIRYFRDALELNPEYASAEDNLRRAQELQRRARR